MSGESLSPAISVSSMTVLETSTEAGASSSPCVISSTVGEESNKQLDTHAVTESLIRTENGRYSDGYSVKEIDYAAENRHVLSDCGCNTSHESGDSLTLNRKTTIEKMSDADEDPYIKLETYLEKVKHEINDVFHVQEMEVEELPSGTTLDNNSKTCKNYLKKQKLASFITHANSDKKYNKDQNVNDQNSLKNHQRQNKKCWKQFVTQPESQITINCKNKTSGKVQDCNDVNIWAQAILKELDNLMGPDKTLSVKAKLDDEANVNIDNSWTHNNILKPQKHTTLPLYSFNLDEQKYVSSEFLNSKKLSVECANKFTLINVTGPLTNNSNPNKALLVNNFENKATTVLKIEENSEGVKPSKLQTRNNFVLKKKSGESNNWSTNDRNDKGSASTIWTSDDSNILRIVCAVDEENNRSTSSSLCDEASVVLSSDSESWKNVCEPLENSYNAPATEKLQTLKYCKRKSIISVEDSDLLDVLSLCGPKLDDCTYDSDFMNIQNAENNLENVTLRKKKIKKVRSHSIGTDKFVSRSNEFEVDESLIEKQSKSKRPFCLALTQEPFQNNSINIRELLSPSSTSLHSENPDLQKFITKSSSAPILLKNEKQKDGFIGQQNILRYSRSQSDRYLAEIEAIEACKWLRAAGFPQYAQMYEDLQFPIDLNNVAKDHPILENDPLQSVYRRLCILNRSSAMRIDNSQKQYSGKKDDSDDEAFALSENWTFQPHSRRWSRIGELDLDGTLQHLEDKIDYFSKDSSPDRFDDTDSSTNNGYSTFPIHLEGLKVDSSICFRRTGSERLKDGAKALLRRVESIKSRRRKRQNREGLIISSPQAIDLAHINQRVSDLKCINIITMSTPPSPSTSPLNIGLKGSLNNELEVSEDHQDKFLSPHRLSPKHLAIVPRSAHSMRSSPLHFLSATLPYLRANEGKSDDSSSYCSDDQEDSCDVKKPQIRRQPSRSRFLQRSGKVDDIGAHSDSECLQAVGRIVIYKDPNFNHAEVIPNKLNRGGSLNLGKNSKKCRENFQSRSFRYRSSTRKNNKPVENEIDNEKSGKHSVRWHSFQANNHATSVFRKCISEKSDILEGTPLSALSCGQLQILRKLALVTLTGHMERYCPTHRSGWNWELPKFIKKIKTPDYKDKRVFGVPLLLVLQRSGHSLPESIRGALRWLKLNAHDQIGLFRKSGVKSRISKLKDQLETSESDCMKLFDNYQAYDVADVLKQYFRDLPESLLTTKISETSIAIFQHLPSDVRPDAMQSAIMLLPDENREVLYVLLKFLSDIASNSHYNQMSANNLAVCLAPSIFNHSIVTGRSHSVSPRRRKVIGVPDMKELSETKAMHECLAFLITNYEQLFTASREKMLRCKFGYMEESKPLPLESLGEGMQFRNWRGYLYESTSATIKEGREKSRGWFTISSLDSSVELAYKKVGDDHPLRLWRNITEIEAPPFEVLNYILNERQNWDVNLLESKSLEKLDEKTEIIQYACRGQSITDYCILRSWQRDLPRGACVIVETSIDHGETPLLLGGVRGVVLASRYLIEPCGNGRSRLMYLARVDTKGRTPEWYNKSYGHICSHYLLKIRAAFKNVTVGPESKV